VIAREIDVLDVGPVTARERPDVALVGLGESSEHALGLIDKIVREAACPVIVLLHSPDPEFLKEASKRGVFARISDAGVEEWQSSIDIVLRRFAEYHDLQGAFGRRALTERAKGILMERHSISEDNAFELLREHSRIANRKLIDLAAAIVDGHRLLPEDPQIPRRRNPGPAKPSGRHPGSRLVSSSLVRGSETEGCSRAELPLGLADCVRWQHFRRRQREPTHPAGPAPTGPGVLALGRASRRRSADPRRTSGVQGLPCTVLSAIAQPRAPGLPRPPGGAGSRTTPSAVLYSPARLVARAWCFWGQVGGSIVQ